MPLLVWRKALSCNNSIEGRVIQPKLDRVGPAPAGPDRGRKPRPARHGAASSGGLS